MSDEFLRSLRVTPGYAPGLPADQLLRYARSHAARHADALRRIRSWARGRRLRVLELGASPYCFTALLARQIECEITCVNIPPGVWPGEMASYAPTDVLLESGGWRCQVPVLLMNVERDLLPFDDESFDVVLCMDLLQHLGYHPTWMFCEARRVLRPDGRLLLTAPNALSLRRLLSLLAGIVDAEPFAARGLYERRQRIATPREMAALAAGSGFRIEQVEHADLDALPERGRPLALARLARLLGRLPIGLAGRREYVSISATPEAPPRAVYPPETYYHVRLYPPIPGVPPAESAPQRSNTAS